MTILKMLDVWFKKVNIYIYVYFSEFFTFHWNFNASLLSPDSEGVDFYRLDTPCNPCRVKSEIGRGTLR